MTIDPIGLMDLQDQPPAIDPRSLSTDEFVANIEAVAIWRRSQASSRPSTRTSCNPRLLAVEGALMVAFEMVVLDEFVDHPAKMLLAQQQKGRDQPRWSSGTYSCSVGPL